MSDKPKTVVFLNFDGTEGSVFWSQVVTPLKSIQQRHGVNVHLIVMNRLDRLLSPRKYSRARDTLRRCGLPSTLLPRLPASSALSFSVNALILYPVLQRLAKEGRPLIVHARGPFSSALALRLRRMFPALNIERVVYDCRGDILAEYDDYNTSDAAKKARAMQRLKETERRALEGVDHVNVVSAPLERLLRERYGYRGSCSITPSAVNMEELDASIARSPNRRAELGLEGRFVLVYSGSMLPWQKPEELVMIFQRFVKAEPKTFFLVLTSDQSVIVPLLQGSGVAAENYRVLSASPDELPSYIACGDVSLLLRDMNGTNRVASPTKFAEYVGCGVPVLMTRGLGDLDQFVLDNNCGWLLDSLRDEKQIEGTIRAVLDGLQSQKARRRELQSTARRLFSIESHADRLLASYGMR